jgi:hypothetical protein
MLTAAGIMGAALGASGLFWAFIQQATRPRVAIFVAVYLVHLAISVLAYQLHLSGGGDADLYYQDPYGTYDSEGFGLSTIFIIFLTQLIKRTLDATMLDLFLIYQSIGFMGIVFLMRSFQEVYEDLQIAQPSSTWWLLFLPSMHYWTSAIGKDALFFFSTCMAVWATIAMRRRAPAFAAASVIMFLVRPHIAALALGSLALSVIWTRKSSLFSRLAIFAVAAAGCTFALVTLKSSFAVDMTSVEGVSGVLEGRDRLVESDNLGGSGVNASFPIRLLSLLFRPLFFDVSNLPGLVASFESVLLMIFVGLLIYRARTLGALLRGVLVVRFTFIYSVITIVGLSLVYYNVGLGLRQKWSMIMPAVLVLFVTVSGLQRVRRIQERAAKIVAHRGPFIEAPVQQR